MGKLLPLPERIRQMNELIDAIVYRLLRLTEENIALEANVQFQWMECVKHLSRKNVCVFRSHGLKSIGALYIVVIPI